MIQRYGVWRPYGLPSFTNEDCPRMSNRPMRMKWNAPIEWRRSERSRNEGSKREHKYIHFALCFRDNPKSPIFLASAPHFHLDRACRPAVDELVDVRIAALVDLRGRAVPDDLALIEHRDAR